MRRLRYLIGINAAINITKSVTNNILYTPVVAKFGAVVYCDLAFGYAEHSGIYVGDNSIVHLNKKGTVEKVALDEFTKGTPAITIYISCINGCAVGSDSIGDFALSQLGKQVKYSIFSNNCHKFSSSCVTQNINNDDLYLYKLKRTVKQTLGVTEWRALAQ